MTAPSKLTDPTEVLAFKEAVIIYHYIVECRSVWKIVNTDSCRGNSVGRSCKVYERDPNRLGVVYQ